MDGIRLNMHVATAKETQKPQDVLVYGQTNIFLFTLSHFIYSQCRFNILFDFSALMCVEILKR